MALDWIDRNLDDIKLTDSFKLYFEEYDTIEDEDVLYILNKEKGIDIALTKKNVVTSIHFYSGEHGDCKTYKGILPHGLKFNLSRKEIHSLLGIPNISGGGEFNLFLGPIRKWDKYIFENYTQHLEYSKDEDRILLITFASKKIEPYLNASLQ